MYCKHCNFKLEGELASAKFCPVCGASLDSVGEEENGTEKQIAVRTLIETLKLINLISSDKMFKQNKKYDDDE